MDSSFTLFPHLPAELRFMIWEACIPHRIVQFRFPWREHPEIRPGGTPPWGGSLFQRTHCGFEWTNMQITQPPIISQVCRESRMIVLKSGGMLQDVSGQIKQWIDTQHDRIAWWWIPDFYQTFFPDIYGDLLSSFVLHAQRTNMEPVIMARGVYPFRPTDQETDYLTLADIEIGTLSELKNFFLCIKAVVVHTDRSQATQSRLWGATGEEFRREMNGDDEKELEFVDSVLNKEEFAAEIAEWELGIRSHLLWVEWRKAFPLAMVDIGKKNGYLVESSR
ncbi:uncharacterized protein N7483_011674 [Penicillium malachiteum]|uniref:uncharacterized protein n=1 Tax=Penicillium malachiteum TaxID=1324776 RepID=UPI0025497E11|nr:uncharacterized protein N7483_011674 [Penicillium malachiteum]KAJ5714493.1 hypothetical protein N7483_011674 [Penicillium malachiteum]